jgi:hypothetical protein
LIYIKKHLILFYNLLLNFFMKNIMIKNIKINDDTINDDTINDYDRDLKIWLDK